MNLLWANLFSIICALAALYLAVSDYSGWGWFLLVALMCSQSAGCKCDDDDEPANPPRKRE